MTVRTRRRSLVSSPSACSPGPACAAATAGTAPSAQQPPQQPIFRAGTDLVRVDVTVTGRGDDPVTDLRMADFEVTEDGVPQVVENMQLRGCRATGPAT